MGRIKIGGPKNDATTNGTLRTREAIQKVVDNEMASDRVMQSLMLLPPEKYLNIMVKLYAFLVPKANAQMATPPPAPETDSVYLNIFTPVASKEEADKVRKEDQTEEWMATMIYYNHASEDRWFATNVVGCTKEEWYEKYGEGAKRARKWAAEILLRKPE